MAWWGKPASIVWLKQLGPLVAVMRPDGSLEVSAYSLSGIFAAAQGVITKALPPRHPDGNQSGPARHEASGVPLAGLSVLVAEDNRLNRNLLRDQLQVLGAQVVEAGNGNEALAVLSEQSVDAVLTDIDMPVMNGFDLLREMKRGGPRVPVYAVSASARPEEVAQGRARGFTGYLTKPVSLAALASVLACAAAPAGTTHADEREGPAALPADDDLPELPRVPAEYVEAFLAQTRADLDEFDATRTEKDMPRLERLLHRIAGTLAVVGRSGLSELCEELRSYAAEVEGWDDEVGLQSAVIAQGLSQVCERLDAGSPDCQRP